MPRSRKCNICPGWHDTDEPWPQECLGHFKHLSDKRSDTVAAPSIFRDEHWPKGVVCNADGQRYYNKSDFYRAVRRAGCEIMGSKDTLPPRPPPVKPKLSDETRREIRARVQALDSPTRKLHERRRRING